MREVRGQGSLLTLLSSKPTSSRRGLRPAVRIPAVPIKLLNKTPLREREVFYLMLRTWEDVRLAILEENK